jgi:hypothetical protein
MPEILGTFAEIRPHVFQKEKQLLYRPGTYSNGT